MRDLLNRLTGKKISLIFWITKVSRSRQSRILVCLGIFAIAYLSYFPEYDRIFEKDAYLELDRQIQNPLKPNDSIDSSHAAKTELRLFLPFLANVLGMDGVGLSLLAQLLAFPFYLIVFHLFRRLIADRTSAILLTTALALSFFGKAFNFHFFKDAYAHFLLVAAAFFPASIWQWILLVCVGFADERAIVAIGIYPLVNMLLRTSDKAHKLSVRSLLYHAIYPVAAVLTIIVLRFYFAETYQLTTPVGDNNGVGLGLIRDSFKWAPLALLNAFDGFWILIFLGFAYLLARKEYLFSAYIGLYILGLMGIAFCVYDITKSLGYLIMIPFIFSYFFKDLTAKQKRNISWVVLVVCLMIPNYYIWGGFNGQTFWLSPIIPKVFKFI